jgi:hypothetical protein
MYRGTLYSASELIRFNINKETFRASLEEHLAILDIDRDYL